jgi:small GTP-binding protein
MREINRYIVYGQCNTGKTLLCNLLSESYVNTYYYQPSIGVEIFTRDINISTPKTLQFWDLCGDAYYYNIIKRYFNLSDNLILTYDTSDIKSFYFLKRAVLLLNTENKKVIILGTKCDLEDVNNNFTEDVEMYANNRNFKYYKVSIYKRETIDNFLQNLNELIGDEQDVECSCNIL